MAQCRVAVSGPAETKTLRGNGAARSDPQGLRSRRLFCVCAPGKGRKKTMNGNRGNRFDRRGFTAALLLGLALAACGSSSDKPAGSGGDIAKVAAEKGIEKSNLKLGFIKLTDMAPLAVAKEKGFFAEEGLNVTLEPQANWKVLARRCLRRPARRRAHAGGPPAGVGSRDRLQGQDHHADVARHQRQGRDAFQPRLRHDCSQPAEGRLAGLRRTAQAGRRQVQGRGQAVQDGHGFPGLHPQLRPALLARRRRLEPRILPAGRHRGHHRGRSPALGHPAAADAGDARSRNDRRLLGRRALEPGGAGQEDRSSGHRRS